jgi:hypothetical protein
MDKKPFDRSQGQGTAAPGQLAKPDPPEKDKMPRPGTAPAGQPVDKRTPKPGAGRKDMLEGDRSDRESGRPVQLEEREDDMGNRRDTATGVRRPEDQTAKR